MAGRVNKVILIGHLGRDPEIRRNGAGNRPPDADSIDEYGSTSTRQPGPPPGRSSIDPDLDDDIPF